MKTAERIILVLLFLTMIGGGVWIYFAVQFDHQETLDAVARGEYEIREIPQDITPDEWRLIYPNTIPALIGSTSVQVSVADSLDERIKGLSNTPFLPDGVVKLFAFGATGTHSIWMKDMNYALDIIWTNYNGEIVHIEENIAPETYPESFASPHPAWYVVEANAGFVSEHNIEIGDSLTIVQ